MAGWRDNTIMEWSTDNGTTWVKITDHGRAPLDSTPERIGTDQRMVNGRMRRYSVVKKRSWDISWSNLPDRFDKVVNGVPNKSKSFLAGGDTPGIWLEEFYNQTDGSFLMRLRAGSDVNSANVSRTGDSSQSDNERVFTVMVTDFSKSVVKRGLSFDMWNLTMGLVEV